MRVLFVQGAASDITMAATHELFVGSPADRPRDLPIHRLLITDTLNQEPTPPM
ncbi:hypothetical protein OG417_24765 [Actinoallomurus sp. NBC_01490]|uniref:hypothetical protein n=1 Tax=Actinoallomurus sp. NBC_01490 TaxID=2903557 RepID=UPI002E353E3C|nr:hypothetical protein [Actinoallomurus sp. NBC_01490]